MSEYLRYEVGSDSHSDHGDGLKMATRCLRAGYSSVMFDGEALAEDDDIRLTQQHAEVAHAAGASLEAAAGSRDAIMHGRRSGGGPGGV